MKKILLAAAMLALSTSFAFADDIMATRYGNTTITTDAKGTQTKIHYAADGTGNVCLTTDPALPGYPNPICAPISAHKVGDSWTAGPFSVTLVQGIQ